MARLKQSGMQTLRIEETGRNAIAFESIMFSKTHDFAFTSSHGRLVTRQIGLGDQGLRVSRVTSTGHRITLTEDADATLLFPRSGALSIRGAGPDRQIARRGAALLAPQRRETLALPPDAGDFHGDVLMIPFAGLVGLADRIGAKTPVGHDFRTLAGPGAGRLSNYISFVLDEVGRTDAPPGDAVRARMLALLWDQLATCLTETDAADDAPGTTEARLEAERVRRAIDIMHACGNEPLTTVDLAQELGISLRSLQLAFQRVCGESPRSYLTRVRLDLAHARLRGANPDEDSVTTIAFDCGFTHLGRFAGVYAKVFGERPSETLARGRGRTPVRDALRKSDSGASANC